MNSSVDKSCYLNRFLVRQEKIYSLALKEIEQGEKDGCWMWFIFPQLRGLAKSRKSFVYGIVDKEEAEAYLAHPVLGARLIECCKVLLKHKDKSAEDIMGDVDAVKFRSSMTLFALISEEKSIFHKVLEQFYNGQTDELTEGILNGKIVDITYRKYMIQ